MEDNISVLIATILLVVIIVIFPIYNVANRQDSMANNIAVKTTTNFVDSVRDKGYLTKEDYQLFINDLDRTGHTYDVEMEIHKPISLPVNTDEYEEKHDIDYKHTILQVIEDSITVDGEVSSNSDSIIKQGIYNLDENYKIYVRVKNTDVTQAQVLFSKTFGGNFDSRIIVNYGGVVYSNEWKRSDVAKIIGANITLSRPKDMDGNEYKYQELVTYINEDTGEKHTLYGIVARLKESDDAPNRGITFTLTYTDVEFPTGVNNKSQREQHILDYIKPFGFDATIKKVKEISHSGRDYKYTISFEDIIFSDKSQTYTTGYLQIDAGSAEALTGPLGLVKSVDFSIFYESLDLEIDYDVKLYDADNNIVIGAGQVTHAIVYPKTNKSNNNIVSVKYAAGEHDENYFYSSGTEIKGTYNSTEQNYNFQVTQNGIYTIYARDNRGREKVKIVEIRGLGSDKLRFVLSWNGTVVRDLDSYMRVTDINNNEIGTVFYSNKTINNGSVHVVLDQDVTTGNLYSYETLEIRKANGGKFQYWVQDYTNRGSTNSTKLADSSPLLKIYRGENYEELIYDSSEAGKGLDVLTGNARIGTRWNVLEYDSTTRDIRWVNTLVNIADGFVY